MAETWARPVPAKARVRPAPLKGGPAVPALIAVMLLSLPMAAHDFWIEPSTFTPALNSVVNLRLRVGEHVERRTSPGGSPRCRALAGAARLSSARPPAEPAPGRVIPGAVGRRRTCARADDPRYLADQSGPHGRRTRGLRRRLAEYLGHADLRGAARADRPDGHSRSAVSTGGSRHQHARQIERSTRALGPPVRTIL